MRTKSTGPSCSFFLELRFHSFLLFLGYSRSMVRETSAEAFCKTVSDFALEYRATRNAILQKKEKEKEKEREKDSQNTPKLKIRHHQSPSDVSNGLKFTNKGPKFFLHVLTV